MGAAIGAAMGAAHAGNVCSVWSDIGQVEVGTGAGVGIIAQVGVGTGADCHGHMGKAAGRVAVTLMLGW